MVWRGVRWSNMNWPQGSPSPHSHFASVQVSFPCGVLAWPTFWSMHWHSPVQGAAPRPTLRLAAGQVAFSTTVQKRSGRRRDAGKPCQGFVIRVL